MVVYLDDTLICSRNALDHRRHVSWVLHQLRAHDLFAKLEKCEFSQPSVEFLGFIVSGAHVQMDPKKIDTVQDWPLPKCLKDVQAFLGLLNFYRRFVHLFSHRARPLIDLTKKGSPFLISPSAVAAFKSLKSEMITAPILQQFNPDLPISTFCDASEWAIAGSVCQPDLKGALHPIIFFSSSLKGAEINWTIYDKELYAIHRTLLAHRPWLVNSPEALTIFSDHKNLEYFFSRFSN